MEKGAKAKNHLNKPNNVLLEERLRDLGYLE
jgi:hypothetical protein